MSAGPATLAAWRPVLTCVALAALVLRAVLMARWPSTTAAVGLVHVVAAGVVLFSAGLAVALAGRRERSSATGVSVALGAAAATLVLAAFLRGVGEAAPLAAVVVLAAGMVAALRRAARHVAPPVGEVAVSPGGDASCADADAVTAGATPAPELPTDGDASSGLALVVALVTLALLAGVR